MGRPAPGFGRLSNPLPEYFLTISALIYFMEIKNYNTTKRHGQSLSRGVFQVFFFPEKTERLLLQAVDKFTPLLGCCDERRWLRQRQPAGELPHSPGRILLVPQADCRQQSYDLQP